MCSIGVDIDIPEDIIFQILSRLASKSLVRFQSVCKSWYAVITQDHDFQLLQLQLNSRNSCCRSWIGIESKFSLDEYIIKNNFWVFDESFTSKELYLPMESEESGNMWFTEIIGSSHGVVCLLHHTIKKYGEGNKWKVGKLFMSLWNPCIRKYKRVDYPWKVPPRNVYRTNMMMGYGYATNSRDHNIVVITKDKHGQDHVYVYSLGSTSWIEIIPKPQSSSLGHIVLEDSSCTFFNGACHWVVTSNPAGETVSYSGNPRKILCFHLDDQKLYYIDLIPMELQPNKGNHRYQTLVYKNMLSICDSSMTTSTSTSTSTRLCIRLWCMKEYGNSNSWTPLFDVHTDTAHTGDLFSVKRLYGTDDETENRLFLLTQDLWTYDPHNQLLKPLPTSAHSIDQLVLYQESLFLL